MLAEIRERRAVPETELWIREVRFKRSRVIMTDIRNLQISLPYRELVAAHLEICDEITGQISHPELSQVTEELKGCLILYDMEYRRIRVHLAVVSLTAGGVLKQLAIHAPFLFWDYMSWMEEGNQEEFFEIRHMVSVMRSAF